MASAFALTLAYLGEHTSARDAAGAFGAYITGNVASNLIGRLCAAFFTDHFGLSGNFLAFAILNLAGAALAAATLERAPPMGEGGRDRRSSALNLAPASLDAGPAGRLRRRLMHPLRICRHVHVCELRARSAAARARHDADRARLSRLRAVDRDDPARGTVGYALRAGRRRTGRAGARDSRRSGAPRSKGWLGSRRIGACWRRDVPRPRGHDRIRRPRRAIRSRRRERTLSRRLFFRRARRQRYARRVVRHVRLARMRGWNHRRTSRRRRALDALRDPCVIIVDVGVEMILPFRRVVGE